MNRSSWTLLSALLLVGACDKSSSETKADTKAETAKADTKVDAKAEAEDEEAAKKAEQEKRARERLAKLDETYKAEGERWTEDVEATAAKLASTEWKELGAALDEILKSPHRMPDNPARDQYRHAKETLAFFGVEPSDTVLEIGPGAGWYTEILAPLLAAQGKLVVTDYDIDGPELEYSTYNAKRLAKFLGRSEATFGKVERVVNKDRKDLQLGAPETYDVVLLIRGMHGWEGREQIADNLKKVHTVLKPGGTFGVVQHRAKEGADPKEAAEKGYLPQAYVVKQAEAVGFELVEASEINANPKDTADHPEGVWTLPPTLALEDKDREKYEGIGESDRMTLKFKKK